MPKVVGIDLAGMEKNKTGACALTYSESPEISKTIKTKILYKDSEIMTFIDQENPELIAFDAPLSKPRQGNRRKCDRELAEYGLLPPMLGGMRYLTQRAIELKNMIIGSYKIIEVSSRASAAILGYRDQEEAKEQKELLKLNIKGDTEQRFLSRDELDAVSAAITAYLHLQGKTRSVGDDEGRIIIPKL